MSRLLVLASLWFALPLPARAEDFVLQSQASQSLVSVTVFPFSGVGDLPEYKGQAAPHAVLRADLDFSERFQVIELGKDKWDSAGLAQQNVSTAITGQVRRGASADEVEVVFKMLDVASKEVLLEKTYTGRKRDLRRLVHRFSDDVVFQLFGERGIASTKIAYVRGFSGHKEIWTMDYDGFGAEAWTANGSINLSPIWDRTGALVWSSYVGGNGSRLWRQVPGQKPRRLLPDVPGMQISASASPLDGEIALATSLNGQTEIFRAYPDGKPLRLTYSPALEVSPTWSPNGYDIAFTSDRTGSPQIYAMDREGSNVRRLTFTGTYNDQPSWSPAGDRIAFARMAGGFQVLTMGIDGNDEKWIGPGEQPKWSPDGRHLVFIRRWGKNSDLWVSNASGTRIRQITFTGDATQPSWSR